jgi:hypothetical protein
MNKLKLLLLALLIASKTQAQSVDDSFRQDGKILVVITVLLIILIGLFIYMIRTDRKITKIEKNEN